MRYGNTTFLILVEVDVAEFRFNFFVGEYCGTSFIPIVMFSTKYCMKYD